MSQYASEGRPLQEIKVDIEGGRYDRTRLKGVVLIDQWTGIFYA